MHEEVAARCAHLGVSCLAMDGVTSLCSSCSAHSSPVCYLRLGSVLSLRVYTCPALPLRLQPPAGEAALSAETPHRGRVSLSSIWLGSKEGGVGKGWFPHSCLLFCCMEASQRVADSGCITPCHMVGHTNYASIPGPKKNAQEIFPFSP